MANICVSHTATPASPWNSFSNAYNTLKEATDYASADDTIYVLNTHTEIAPVNTTYTLLENVHVYSVNSSYVYTRGASVTINAASGVIDVYFGSVYGSFNGIDFTVDDDIFFTQHNQNLWFNDCGLDGIRSGSKIQMSGTDQCITFNDSTISTDSSGLTAFTLSDTKLTLNNTVVSSGSGDGSLMSIGSSHATVSCNNCDFSGVLLTDSLINSSATEPYQSATFYRCTLPPNITSINKNTPLKTGHFDLELTSCTLPDLSGTGDDNNALWSYYKLNRMLGVVVFDTATHLSATYDGSTGYSVEMDGMGCSAPDVLKYKLCSIPASDLETSKVVTVHFTCADTLNTAQFFISLIRPDATDFALGYKQSERPADILGSGSAHTTDSVSSWTGGKTNKYEDSITIPALTGVDDAEIEVYANLVEPNTSVWVDPLVVIT